MATEHEPGSLILAVDDQPINLRVVSQSLERHGFQVICAENGEEALALARSRSPDLILLDVDMPGLGGFEICEILKEDQRLQQIPVIFLTGYGSTEDIVKGFDVGGVDYITKPFAAAELVARVRTHVQLHQLKQILPICSYCNRIRNEHDDWERVADFIHRQMGADFSHSICPECFETVRKKYGLSRRPG